MSQTLNLARLIAAARQARADFNAVCAERRAGKATRADSDEAGSLLNRLTAAIAERHPAAYHRLQHTL